MVFRIFVILFEIQGKENVYSLLTDLHTITTILSGIYNSVYYLIVQQSSFLTSVLFCECVHACIFRVRHCFVKSTKLCKGQPVSGEHVGSRRRNHYDERQIGNSEIQQQQIGNRSHALLGHYHVDDEAVSYDSEYSDDAIQQRDGHFVQKEVEIIVGRRCASAHHVVGNRRRHRRHRLWIHVAPAHATVSDQLYTLRHAAGTRIDTAFVGISFVHPFILHKAA